MLVRLVLLVPAPRVAAECCLFSLCAAAAAAATSGTPRSCRVFSQVCSIGSDHLVYMQCTQGPVGTALNLIAGSLYLSQPLWFCGSVDAMKPPLRAYILLVLPQEIQVTKPTLFALGSPRKSWEVESLGTTPLGGGLDRQAGKRLRPGSWYLQITFVCVWVHVTCSTCMASGFVMLRPRNIRHHASLPVIRWPKSAHNLLFEQLWLVVSDVWLNFILLPVWAPTTWSRCDSGMVGFSMLLCLCGTFDIDLDICRVTFSEKEI
ncbi:hypothetical protein QBC44DRAFT_151247 [Cladorrhinum sp. PSN332]|nr:hypothetical protein QBC44DRAFT_151247 [Cladorrhinum sp. PSN332]